MQQMRRQDARRRQDFEEPVIDRRRFIEIGNDDGVGARERAGRRADELSIELASTRACNARLPAPPLLDTFLEVALRALRSGYSQTRGSARSVHQLVRVARTIADLDAAPRVHPHHVEEALLLCIGRRFDAPSLAVVRPSPDPTGSITRRHTRPLESR